MHFQSLALITPVLSHTSFCKTWLCSFCLLCCCHNVNLRFNRMQDFASPTVKHWCHKRVFFIKLLLFLDKHKHIITIIKNKIKGISNQQQKERQLQRPERKGKSCSERKHEKKKEGGGKQPRAKDVGALLSPARAQSFTASVLAPWVWAAGSSR